MSGRSQVYSDQWTSLAETSVAPGRTNRKWRATADEVGHLFRRGTMMPQSAGRSTGLIRDGMRSSMTPHGRVSTRFTAVVSINPRIDAMGPQDDVTVFVVTLIGNASSLLSHRQAHEPIQSRRLAFRNAKNLHERRRWLDRILENRFRRERRTSVRSANGNSNRRFDYPD